ncbi:MAG: Hsp70 family protein [Alphaproteobacteria bacterium]|nr:Hsp70 family protein [Alphaproteobacteria bacterium]
MFTVGIDLGTTASVISYLKDGTPEAIQIDGGVTVPSVVNYSEDRPIVGSEAIYNADSANTIFSVKRRMGSNEKIFGRSPAEISADILSYIKMSAEMKLGKKIDAAVITVPAHFSDAQRTATKQAASIAGIKVLRLINEPTAAAIAFGLDKRKNGIFAVYDLGGGTFDFSVLRLSDGIFQVLATGGDNNLGGDDADEKILEDNFRRNDITDPTLNEKMLGKRVAKFLKENLGDQESVKKDFAVRDKICKFELTREKAKKYLKEIFARTFLISSQVLEDAEISSEDLDGIVLVGGMTKLDFIKNFVAENFKTKIFDDISPEKAVSFGAAIQANSIVEKDGMLLIDVVPLTLGIETFGGGVDKIIHRNTPIPIAERREYTTYQDNQTGMKFRVLQGERPLADECRTLANFELKGIPALPAGLARVIVEFSIDVNGLLDVKAYEKSTGVSQEVVVESSAGLSDEDMMEILEKAFSKKESDQIKANNIAIKIETERSIRFWKSIIKEIPEDFQKIASEKILKLEEILAREKFQEVIPLKNELENIFGRFLDEIINNHLSGKKLRDIRGVRS